MINIENVATNHLDGLVAVEFDRYGDLHSETGLTKLDLRKRFEKRLKSLGAYFFVALHDDTVVGSMSVMPTNSPADEFVSWEKSTSNGDCSTYDGSGPFKFLYIVNLDTMSDHQHLRVSDALIGHMTRIVISEGFREIYFESRMPGFRSWVGSNVADWDILKIDERYKIAQRYSVEKRSDGLPLDSLLRFYHRNGFKKGVIVGDAFNDPESLNYGVVFSRNNPVCYAPEFLRKILAAHHEKIERFF